VDRGQVKREVFPRITYQAIAIDGPVPEKKQRVWLRGYMATRYSDNHRVVTSLRADREIGGRGSVSIRHGFLTKAIIICAQGSAILAKTEM